jgi:hypothetical protein
MEMAGEHQLDAIGIEKRLDILLHKLHGADIRAEIAAATGAEISIYFSNTTDVGIDIHRSMSAEYYPRRFPSVYPG